MHLFSFQNRVPTNVVNKIGQANIEFSPFDSYRAKRNSVHRAGHKAEYMLNPAAGFGFFSVVFLLLIAQRFAAIPFFTDTVFHMVGDIFADIGAVCINNFVFFGKKISELVAVMDICGRSGVIRDDLAVSVYLDMILISVMRFVVFLCPTGIRVLLRKFMRIFLPCFLS